MARHDRPFILGLGGTARDGSSSEVALHYALAAAERLGARTQLFGGAFLSSLPLYAPGAQLRTASERAFVDGVRAADGLIISTPSYHGSLSGVVKNAIDLIEETSRDSRVYLDGCPVGLIVTAYGWQAAGITLTAMRSIVHALRGWPTPIGVALNVLEQTFDADGAPRDQKVADTLATMAGQIVSFTQARTLEPAS